MQQSLTTACPRVLRIIFGLSPWGEFSHSNSSWASLGMGRKGLAGGATFCISKQVTRLCRCLLLASTGNKTERGNIEASKAHSPASHLQFKPAR